MKRLIILFLLIAPLLVRAQAVQEKLEKIVLDWINSNVKDTCTLDTGKFDPHTIVCSNGQEQKNVWNLLISAKLIGDKITADSLKVVYDMFRCDTTGYQVMYEFSYLSKDKMQHDILLSATTDRSMVIQEIIYYDPEGITEIPSRLIYQRKKRSEAGKQGRK